MFMKRYKVKKVGTEYQILDTLLNLVVAQIARKDAADRACKTINQNYQTQMSAKKA